MLRNFARACGCIWMLATSLALASGACVSPDTFVRDDDAGHRRGGHPAAAARRPGRARGGSSSGTAGSTAAAPAVTRPAPAV